MNFRRYSKRVYCFAFILGLYTAYRLLLKRISKQYHLRPGKRIFFGGGGGMVAYFMGVAHAIFTAFGTKAFRDFQLEGVSAGAYVAGYSIAVIHNIHDMKYWYYRHVRKAYEHAHSRLLGMFFTLHSTLARLGEEYYLECSQAAGSWNLDNHVCYATELPSLNLSTIDDVTSAEEMGLATASTGYIPFSVGVLYSLLPKRVLRRAHSSFGNFHRIPSRELRDSPNSIVIDGGIAFSIHDVICDDNETVLFGVGCETIKNSTYTNLKAWGTLSIFDFIVTGNLSKADNLFWNGFEDAIRNIDEIQRIFEMKFEMAFPIARENIRAELESKNLFEQYNGRNIDFRNIDGLFV